MFRSTLTRVLLASTLTLICSSAFGQIANLPISTAILQEIGESEESTSLLSVPVPAEHAGQFQNAFRTELIPVTVECFPMESRLDIDNDGRIDSMIERQYNPNGLLREEIFRFDNALADLPSKARRTTYNEDGFPVMRITRTSPTQSGMSHRFNSSFEDIEVMRRDTSGALLEHSIDLGNDGERDEQRSFEYDRRGLETVESIDEDADGNIDAIRTTTLFPAEGIIEIVLEGSHQRTVLSSTLIRLDEDNRPLVIETDVDGDGTLDTRQKNTYDGDLLIGSWSRDETGEETLTIFGYDHQGNQVLMATDLGNDGTMEEVLHTTFACP